MARAPFTPPRSSSSEPEGGASAADAQQQSPSGSPVSAVEGLVSKNLPLIARQSRALVVVAAIVAVAALGFTAVVDDQASRIVGMGVFLALMLVITSLLYGTSRASTEGDEDTDPAAVGRGLSAVNGRWWQLVLNDETPGLSIIEIDLSVLPNRHQLSGTKYRPDGKEMATWRSRAVGLMSVKPAEVFYYWVGSYSGVPGSVSGIGFFSFPPAPTASVATGTGWFTTGDVERADFSVLSKVHLRRVSPAEHAVIDGGGEGRRELLRHRYEAWQQEIET